MQRGVAGYGRMCIPAAPARPFWIFIAMLDFLIKAVRRELNARRRLCDGAAPKAPSDRPISAWPQPPRRRRAVVVSIGVAIHGALLLSLLNARLDVAVPVQQGNVWTNLLPLSPPPALSRRPPPIIRAVARPLVVPVSRLPIPAPPPAAALAATVPASAASVPLPAASDSGPLRLTLTPSELRALEASTPRTLAQGLAPSPAAPLLAQRLSPTPQFEEDDRNGIHTVRSHGGCYILIPSGQAKVDPFNHGGERVTGRATNDNC